jgi:hypothetical protein
MEQLLERFPTERVGSISLPVQQRAAIYAFLAGIGEAQKTWGSEHAHLASMFSLASDENADPECAMEFVGALTEGLKLGEADSVAFMTSVLMMLSQIPPTTTLTEFVHKAKNDISTDELLEIVDGWCSDLELHANNIRKLLAS